MKKAVLTILALLLCLSFVLTGCGQSSLGNSSGETQKEDDSQYEFEFTGSTEIQGTEYHSTIYGNEDSTFALRIEELPTAEMTGTWTFVDGKGYKLYFDDTNSSFRYTKYDPETKQFSFNYKLDLGDTNGGSGDIQFVYEDADFANQYDGEGLGPMPPVFNGYTTYMGAMVALGEPMKCTLTCYEDGTCTSVSSNEVKFASPRNGTWSFDEESNTYTFEMEPEPFEGAAYWKFTKPVGTPLEDAAEHWTIMGGEEGSQPECYWESVPVEEPYTNNTFTTEYDEETNTYYLLMEHGLSGANEYADRYFAYTPEE